MTRHAFGREDEQMTSQCARCGVYRVCHRGLSYYARSLTSSATWASVEPPCAKGDA